jgi:hypothetical protein
MYASFRAQQPEISWFAPARIILGVGCTLIGFGMSYVTGKDLLEMHRDKIRTKNIKHAIHPNSNLSEQQRMNIVERNIQALSKGNNLVIHPRVDQNFYKHHHDLIAEHARTILKPENKEIAEILALKEVPEHALPSSLQNYQEKELEKRKIGLKIKTMRKSNMIGLNDKRLKKRATIIKKEPEFLFAQGMFRLNLRNQVQPTIQTTKVHAISLCVGLNGLALLYPSKKTQ